MPSTPRMIQIEAKASQPGEPLTQAEVSLWHDRLLVSDRVAGWMQIKWDDHPPLSADTHKAIRYLDSTGYKRMRPMNEGP